MDILIKLLVGVSVVTAVLVVLPSSPFTPVLQTLANTPYLGYLNWFFPVGRCITLLTSWGLCIAAYYGVAWILRLFGVLGK